MILRLRFGRLFPSVIIGLSALLVLRTISLWVGFSDAQAQPPTSEIQPSTPPIELAVETHDTAEERNITDYEFGGGITERRLLERLADRRKALDQREADLQAREDIITAAELRLVRKLDNFEKERASLEKLRTNNEDNNSADIEALVSAYERMKPKDAAAIFNELEKNILISVAKGMRTQALAGVLAEMTPDNARELTIYLAERNKVALEEAVEAIQ